MTTDTAGESQYFRATFTQKERDHLASTGAAMKDGSYPIRNKEDLHNAIQAFGRAKNPDAVKAHIISRAKALGLTSMLPDSWNAGSRSAGDEWEMRYATTQLREVEFREPTGPEATGDGCFTLTGYAAVFNSETTLRDGKFARLREQIQPGAFRDVLASNPDVHLLIGHNLDLPLARTGIRGKGGLELSEDQNGLRVFARMNPNISYVRDLAEHMRDGVIDQMSFAFTVPHDGDSFETTDLPDGRSDSLRTINRVGRLFDVTVTPQGAYSETSASLRSLAGLSRRAPADSFGYGAGDLTVAPANDLAGGRVVAPDEGDAVRELARARARARKGAIQARNAYPPRRTA